MATTDCMLYRCIIYYTSVLDRSICCKWRCSFRIYFTCPRSYASDCSDRCNVGCKSNTSLALHLRVPICNGILYFYCNLLGGWWHKWQDSGFFIYLQRHIRLGGGTCDNYCCFLISIFILVPICHLFFFGLYCLKCVLYRRCIQIRTATQSDHADVNIWFELSSSTSPTSCIYEANVTYIKTFRNMAEMLTSPPPPTCFNYLMSKRQKCTKAAV